MFMNDIRNIGGVVRPQLRLVLVLLALGVLSGCAVFESLQTRTQNEGKQAAEGASAKTAPVPPVPPAKPVAQLDPKRLVGMNEGQVSKLIGSPKEVRDEPPALVWRYTGDNCSVDVLFYFDLTRQEFRALAYRFDASGRSEQAQRICLGGIEEAQRGSKP